MEQLEGFKKSDKENFIYRLKKNLYGLKQVPSQWYMKFNSFIIDHKYHRTTSDHCVYVKSFPDGDFIILLLYIDDMLIVGRDTIKFDWLKKKLNKSFAMKDLDPARQYWG